MHPGDWARGFFASAFNRCGQSLEGGKNIREIAVSCKPVNSHTGCTAYAVLKTFLRPIRQRHGIQGRGVSPVKCRKRFVN